MGQEPSSHNSAPENPGHEKEDRGAHVNETLTSSGETTCDSGEMGTAAPKAHNGRSIGPYVLLKMLGEGGMGQVWLAQQTKPVKRQVALKLIKGGLYDSAVLVRFESERQSLALMNHPAIAKVFDAGSTQDGQPYFVMEYVSGLSLTRYCDERRLKIPERLELFIKVCEGVQHAHQKAIIHRDLKPSNVLVEEVDGKPVPRIIDFGIAKAISSQPSSEQTMFTQAGAIIGTPGFMSPEQADPSVEDVDTRTDVYSLGMILYALLSGTLPFDVTEWKGRPLDEVLRQLREEDPPSPSTKLAAEKETATAAAEKRGTEPKHLAHLLRGDLDWITLKAIEKDRARRYATPSELAVDIRRYLANEPVVARPASAAYRLGKYVRRHRIGVGVAAALVMLLAGFAIVQAVELRRITRERDRANRITDFMTSIFKVSDPSEARGNTVTAREVLDKASASIGKGLEHDRELQAQLLTVMAFTYDSLGLYPQAQALHERAADLRRRTLGPRNRDTLRSEAWLAWDLACEGHYPEAEKLSREVLEVQRQVLGPDQPQTLETMYNLAWILQLEGRNAEAERLDRETLERRRRVLGPEHRDTLNTMGHIGLDLQDQGKFAEEEAILKDVLETERRVFGPDAPDPLITEVNLATALAKEGRNSEAEKVQREALEIARRVWGPEHPDTLRTELNLGVSLDHLGRLGEAEKVFAQVLESERRVLGPDHPDVVRAMSNLAAVLTEEHKFSDAEALNRQAFEIQRRTLGPENRETLSAMNELANSLMDLGKLTEARRVYEDALAIERRALGPDDPRTTTTMYNLACNAARSGRPGDAIALLNEAVNHQLSSDILLGIAQDTDLTSLHNNPDFKAIVARAKQKADAAQHSN
jgi:eukaryotic-like serine/threonine-protein kinase